MKKEPPKKRNLSGTIEPSPSSASSADQVIAHSPSNFLDEINLWDSTFNAVEDAICIIDNDQRIVRCNTAMQKFSENENENLIGMHCYKVIHGTEYPHPECPFRKMMQTGKRESAEVQEGDQWLDVTVDPLLDPDKQLTGAVHIIRNITERKQAEEVLRESKKMYRLLVRNLPGTTVFLFDHQLRYILAEGNLHPEFSFTIDKMEGKTLWEVLPEERAARLAPNYSRALQGIASENLISEYKGLSYSANILPVKNKKGKIVAGMVVSQEITQRKLTEEALRNSEKKWKKLVNTLPDYVALYDRDGKYLFLNHFAEGFSIKDIEGKSYTDLLTEDSKVCYQQAFEAAKKTGNTQCVEHDAFGDNWTIKHYESYFVPIFEKEQFENMMVIARDITERKLADVAIRESEERFRSLLQNVSSVSVQGYSPDGTTQYWNKASEELYGYTEQEAVGRNLIELIIPPEMCEVVEQAILHMAQTGQPIPSSELSLMRKDGSRVSVFSSHSIVQSPGKPQELFCIDIDLTERKQIEAEILKSKQQYDTLVTQISVGVYILKTKPDRTFALEYASPRMAEMLDLSVESLLANNKTIFKAIHPDDLDGFIRLNQEGIPLKRAFDWKGRVVTKGNIRWLHISSLPQPLDNGETLWHGLIVDITERIQNESEIKLKNEELTNLNATKDKFFSIIAHDLKSPFNSIIGFSNLLIRQIEEKDYASIERYAGIIQNSSQQAMDLLMNLLEWSRSQTGRIVYTPEKINFSTSIDEVTELFFALAQQKSITIYKTIPDSISIYADKAMISTILRNLISNAIKFTNVGGEISISAEQILNDLVVSVSDNGVGMDESAIGKLFRIDETHTTLGTENEKGTGLGLLLCKEFIEKHGGKIWVESFPGKGSKFHFSIPNSISANSSSN